jgi:hypothetical protein
MSLPMSPKLATTLIDPNWKMPPKEKVYEALSAVVDGRVKLIGASKAEVTSSGGEKNYLVEWSEDGTEITSNDNASFWQGYIGYPIIAVLLVTGRIPYESESVGGLAGISWKKINKQHKNDYAKATQAVLQDLAARGIATEPITETADRIFNALQSLPLRKMTSRRQRPPIA